MSPIKITKDQIKTINKIGKSKTGDVFHLVGKGGYNIIIHKDANGSEIVGAAPHRALAKYLAQKKHDDITFFELSKNNDMSFFEHLVPIYQEFTEKLNTATFGK